MYEVNDLLTDLYPCEDNCYHQGAVDYHEHIIIKNNDIEYVTDLYAVARGIIAVLKTRIGEIDGVGMENFGCRLLELRGVPLNHNVTDLAKTYINQIIPQFKGRVINFSDIKIKTVDKSKMQIQLTALTVYGEVGINVMV